MMKPSPGKVALFLVLAFILSFLPFYPVHMDRYTGPEEYRIDEFEESGIKMKSLYIVLEGNFNWTEMDYTMRQESLFYIFTDYHLSYYDASQYYLAMYVLLFIAAYWGSCSYVESLKKS